MRILLVHCRYRLAGGEDTVFETEAIQLEQAGHDVVRVEFSNDDVSTETLFARLKAGLETVWSSRAKTRLAHAIARHAPQVVHFHNTFPLISPAAYLACVQAGVPVVQTLHNFRLLCANAMFMRDGAICEACAGGRFFNGVRHACYRDSRLASSAVALMQYLHHGLGTYARQVDRFIVLTEFARRKFVAGGLPAARLVVKPNSLAQDPGMGAGGGDYCLFVGRLSAEKGVHTLLEAWRQLPDVPLVVAGDGPERAAMERQLAAAGASSVRLLGAVPRSEVLRLMGEARMLVMPSEWYEGFPMTIVEAYSRGLPVLAAHIGSLGEVVVDGQTGRHFRSADAADLASAVRALNAAPAALAAMRERARRRFLDLYGAPQNVAALVDIYSRVARATPIVNE